MEAILSNSKELIIRGFKTHIVAETLCKDLKDLLLSKDLNMYFFLEGSPGPLGEGMVIKVVFSRRLSSADIEALKKFFNVRGIYFITK
ncbi:MAG TPA: hypothetical protein ENG05_02510 [Acidilobales archaeon]|nr:hypothetical protein [Acidilobales archaeon]